DADLGEARDMALLGRAAHRIAVPLAHPMADIDEIEMGNDLHDVDGSMPAEGPDAGNVDRMIAAEHHGHCAAIEDLAHRALGIGVAPTARRSGMPSSIMTR